jgi:hypothetical protein
MAGRNVCAARLLLSLPFPISLPLLCALRNLPICGAAS